MMKQLATRIIYLASLLSVWLILMGIPKDYKSTLSCLGSLFIVYFISWRVNILPNSIKLKPYFFIYLIWLIGEIYKSAFSVMKISWSKKLRINSGFEWIESNQNEKLARVIYANSITLTPGTIASEVKGKKILVHALDISSIEDLNKGEMSKKVSKAIL